MSQKDTDFQKIKKLIKIMKANDLVEVEIKHADDKILLKRSSPQHPTLTAIPVMGHGVGAAAGSAPAGGEEAEAKAKDDGLIEIESPLVGTFYSTPGPDLDAYVEVGDTVDPQAVVCIIEAMKVMNEIKAGKGGKIVEILVDNGQAVEFGQVLFKIKPE